jgi:hypothetical protein
MVPAVPLPNFLNPLRDPGGRVTKYVLSDTSHDKGWMIFLWELD